MEPTDVDDVLEADQGLKAAPTFELPNEANDGSVEVELLEYQNEIPPPDDGFLHICAAIDPNMSETLRDNVWMQVCTMSEKVDLDDEIIAYVACAFYCVMLETEKFQQRPFPYSMLTILKICSVRCTSAFTESLPSEDLLTTFHLLLCVTEWVYKDLCFHGCDGHIDQESVTHMMESKDGVRILEILCRSFDGVLIDAKHFRTHWFNVKRASILPCLDHADLNILKNFDKYLTSVNNMYNDMMLMKGELDERMFLPTDVANIFDPSYDSLAVEILRRGSAESRFADAELLLTMSTQNCLEKLADVKRSPARSDAKSYVISSQQLRPLCSIVLPDSTATSAQRLSPLVPNDFKLEGSSLERCCFQMRDNPLSVIALSAEMIGERFVERVAAEFDDRGEEFDPMVSQSVEEVREAMTNLFFVLIERIVLEERKRNPERDLEGLLRKEEFLSAVFCCAMELVLFVHGSERMFPWCLEVCGLPALSFQKIIEVIVRNEPRLTRDMVRHLNKVEERVLEELAWSRDSPLWTLLNRKPDSVPSCDEAWGNAKNVSAISSPSKRIRFDVDRCSFSQTQLPPCNAQKSFFSKVYYLASIRLSDICERIRVDDRGKRMMWTVLEHILKQEWLLFMDRHLDQNLLCIVCSTNALSNDDGSSLESSSGADSMPLRSRSTVGLSPGIPITGDGYMVAANSTTPQSEIVSGQYVDLIVYYNKVFLPRVEGFMKRITDNCPLSSLTPMPPRRIPRGTPLKRCLSEKVTVMPYNPLPYIQRADVTPVRYKVSQNPSRDFRAINQLFNKNRALYSFVGVSELTTPTGYRVVL
uniref:RB_A domain-containing protein n=1 Tax=Angiostrongylus cantonensis TaxID=6313 RepID=A0A0K0CXZ8_ANGCA